MRLLSNFVVFSTDGKKRFTAQEMKFSFEENFTFPAVIVDFDKCVII